MVEKDTSLYQVSSSQIFFKNFLVGFSRALGGLFIQLIGLAIFYYLFVRFALPTLSPMMDQLQTTVNQLQKIQNANGGQQQIVIPPEFIEQFNRPTTAPTTR